MIQDIIINILNTEIYYFKKKKKKKKKNSNIY